MSKVWIIVSLFSLFTVIWKHDGMHDGIQKFIEGNLVHAMTSRGSCIYRPVE